MIHEFFFNLLFFWLIFIADCSHFNGGTITWRLLNASATETPVSIIITQTYSWSYPLMSCTSSMIAFNQLVPNYSGLATKILQCINNCGATSAGYSNLSVIPYCIAGSSAFGVSIGQRFDTIDLTSGDDFSVAYQDNSWRILATSPAAAWSLTSRINVQSRSDNGLYNDAPLSTIMSPIYIPVNETIVINIPVIDADNDILRCRWANSSNGVDECAGICPPSSLPPGTVLYPNCTLVITGQNVGSWYAIAIMVEDFISSSSTIPLSSIPIQFLVYMTPSSLCSEPPVVVGTSLNDACQVVTVGQKVNFQLIATTYCGSNVSIVDILLVAFSEVIQTNITQFNSTTYYKNINWIPTFEQLGYQIMCAMALDSQNLQSSSFCLYFYVSITSLCACPNQACSTTTTTTTTTSGITSTSSKSTSTTSTSVSTTSTTSKTSTTSTVITIISTTSTSAYIYTTNTTVTSAISVTDTITSTKPGEADLHKWLIIGSLVGVSLLVALILCGCLCWHYCLPCGIGSLKNSDCQGPFEFYHIDLSTDESSSELNASDSLSLRNYIDISEYTIPDVSNRFTRRRQEKEQRSNHEYTDSTFEVEPSLRPYRNNNLRVKRTRRMKPSRVTVISHSLSPSQLTMNYPYTISNRHLMNLTPDYERKINNVHVRHVRWPQ